MRKLFIFIFTYPSYYFENLKTEKNKRFLKTKENKNLTQICVERRWRPYYPVNKII